VIVDAHAVYGYASACYILSGFFAASINAIASADFPTHCGCPS
jgi:hypothetical protein